LLFQYATSAAKKKSSTIFIFTIAFLLLMRHTEVVPGHGTRKENTMNLDTNQASATLCAHTGAVKVDRQQLALITPPARTASHVPVAHAELVETIERSLVRRDFRVAREEFAVQTDGMKIFGTFILEHASADFAFALGFRAANDKSMAISLVAGMSVFVCDNMALSGSCITLTRKHTSGLNLVSEIDGGVLRALGQFDALKADTDRLKGITLKDAVAKSLILDAALKGVMPTRLVHDVAKNYFTPPHEEFTPRTAWSLHNAFTESFKALRPNIAQESSISLGSMFQIGEKVN
jgi:hypothetical protein